MMRLALKIDVDTDRGTRIGVPNLLALFSELKIPATFLFSLGPDNTGRAIKRIFRPGFLKKVSRTSVISTYGLRTLLNGVLLPGPHIGRRNADVMRQTQTQGHEVGIHCYDHIRWQDGLAHMTQEEVSEEFDLALQEFKRIFEMPAQTAGAAGWQANAHSLSAYDDANLLYGSDGRGTEPFFPRVGETVYKTLQIPSTLPTLDELLGRPEYPEKKLFDHYFNLLKTDRPNVFTIHAEVEGMAQLKWFSEFVRAAKNKGIEFVTLASIAHDYLQRANAIPICELIMGTIDGRSGTLAVQEAYNQK
jgi:undecaprenyl phosphate-alpha-L-ara4FN deformylase